MNVSERDDKSLYFTCTKGDSRVMRGEQHYRRRSSNSVLLVNIKEERRGGGGGGSVKERRRCIGPFHYTFNCVICLLMDVDV